MHSTFVSVVSIILVGLFSSLSSGCSSEDEDLGPTEEIELPTCEDSRPQADEACAAKAGADCQMKEWIYYSDNTFTTVVGSKDIFCCSHRSYSNGEKTKFCDIIVSSCDSGGPGEIERSSNCKS